MISVISGPDWSAHAEGSGIFHPVFFVNGCFLLEKGFAGAFVSLEGRNQCMLLA